MNHAVVLFLCITLGAAQVSVQESVKLEGMFPENTASKELSGPSAVSTGDQQVETSAARSSSVDSTLASTEILSSSVKTLFSDAVDVFRKISKFMDVHNLLENEPKAVFGDFVKEYVRTVDESSLAMTNSIVDTLQAFANVIRKPMNEIMK